MGEKAIREKEQIVEELKDKFQRAQAMVFYDYIGLTVSEVSALRNQFRKADVEYRVIKNSMLRRAADGVGISGLDPYFKGPTAVAFSYSDPVIPAKILSEFIKQMKKTQIKCGVLMGRAIDAQGVSQLATLPSKEELIARVLGSMNAPVTGFVMALSGVLRKLLYALHAVKEAKEA